MVVGDLNADPYSRNGTYSYSSLIAGRFDDAWSQLYPHRQDLTWGHDSYLAAKDWNFVWRIDLVLSKAHTLVPKEMETVDSELRRLASPFWPSGHAGVWAGFELKQGVASLHAQARERGRSGLNDP